MNGNTQCHEFLGQLGFLMPLSWRSQPGLWLLCQLQCPFLSTPLSILHSFIHSTNTVLRAQEPALFQVSKHTRQKNPIKSISFLCMSGKRDDSWHPTCSVVASDSYQWQPLVYRLWKTNPLRPKEMNASWRNEYGWSWYFWDQRPYPTHLKHPLVWL